MEDLVLDIRHVLDKMFKCKIEVELNIIDKMPIISINDGKIRVLKGYNDETFALIKPDKKLGVLDDIYKKIELIKQIVLLIATLDHTEIMYNMMLDKYEQKHE